MYKNNTVQAFCCFFYDKVIFCRRYNKAGGIIILLLFLSENIRSMKKILNNLLRRLKEDSLNKRVGNSTREVEYKEKREIKTCLVFWSADTDQNKWFRKLESDFAGVKMDKLCFIPDGIEMLETDDLVAVRNADLGFGGKIRNGRLIAMLGCKYDLFIDLNKETTALIKFVLQHTQASCIVGMKKEGGVADIVIDEVTEPFGLVNKLNVILSGINKY